MKFSLQRTENLISIRKKPQLERKASPQITDSHLLCLPCSSGHIPTYDDRGDSCWDSNRGPELHGSARHLLESFFFSPPEVEVPLNHFPHVLSLLICELGKVQLLPHLCASSRPHLESHRVTAINSRKPPGTPISHRV